MNPSREQTYARTLKELDTANVRWLVQRGADRWPLVTGDLDLLVHPDDMATAKLAACRAIQAEGWKTVVVCDHVDIPVVWGASPDSRDIVELDLADKTSWATGEFLDIRRVLKERRRDDVFWRARPGDSSALLGVPALLGSADVRATKGCKRLSEVRNLIAADREGARQAWTEAVGTAMATRVLDAVDSGDMAAIARVATWTRLRRATANTIISPCSTFSRITDVAWRRRRRATCGLWETKSGGLRPVRDFAISISNWPEFLRSVKQAHDPPEQQEREWRRRHQKA